MLQVCQILVSPIALALSVASLAACGQQGALYLPTEPAAAKRATLPETLMRSSQANTAQPEAQAAPASVKPPTAKPVMP